MSKLKKFAVGHSNNTLIHHVMAHRWVKVDDWVYFYKEECPSETEQQPVAVAYKPAFVKDA